MDIDAINFHTHDLDAPIVTLNSDEYPGFKPQEGQKFMVGIHPWSTERYTIDDFINIADAFINPAFVALGEVGIDPNRGSDIDRQMWLLNLQVKHAQAAGFPVVFHIVKRFDLLVKLYNEMRPTTPWAVHGFRGKPEVVQQLARLGIYMSLGHDFNPESAAAIPDDLLLIETDEEPHATTEEVVCRVAVARKQKPETVAALAAENRRRFFER